MLDGQQSRLGVGHKRNPLVATEGWSQGATQAKSNKLSLSAGVMTDKCHSPGGAGLGGASVEDSRSTTMQTHHRPVSEDPKLGRRGLLAKPPNVGRRQGP